MASELNKLGIPVEYDGWKVAEYLRAGFDMREDGAYYNTIASRLGRSASFWRTQTRLAGVTVKRRHGYIDSRILANAAALYTQGKSLREVAEELGRTKTFWGRHLQRRVKLRPSKHYSRIPPVSIEIARVMYAAGEPWAKISATVGANTYTIRGALGRAGLRRKHTDYTEDDAKYVLGKRASGMSYRDIAKSSWHERARRLSDPFITKTIKERGGAIALHVGKWSKQRKAEMGKLRARYEGLTDADRSAIVEQHGAYISGQEPLRRCARNLGMSECRLQAAFKSLGLERRDRSSYDIPMYKLLKAKSLLDGGMTQQDVQRETGISISTVGLIKSGKYKRKDWKHGHQVRG